MPYNDIPGPRLAYDLNGTVGTIRSAGDGVVRDLAAAAVSALNTERNNCFSLMANGTEWLSTVYDITLQHIFLLFPVPMQLFGVFVSWCSHRNSVDFSSLVDMQTSPNSTNGVDGDWTYLFTNYTSIPSGDILSVAGINYTGASQTARNRSVNDAYRRSFDVEGVGIRSVNGPASRNVRAIRMTRQTNSTSVADDGAGGVVLHLYGQPEEDTVADKLEFWATGATLPLGAESLDWGDIVPSSSEDRSFKIKNLSVSKTASVIVISAQDSPATTTPAPKDEFVFSLDGSTWTTTVTIGALSPGATSGTVYVRRVTPSNAVLSNWVSRFVADVTGGWA